MESADRDTTQCGSWQLAVGGRGEGMVASQYTDMQEHGRACRFKIDAIQYPEGEGEGKQGLAG